MHKWEYTEIVVHYFPDGQLDFITQNGNTVLLDQDTPDRRAYLNRLGQAGWELVTVYPSTGWTEIYHFKRPID